MFSCHDTLANRAVAKQIPPLKPCTRASTRIAMEVGRTLALPCLRRIDWNRPSGQKKLPLAIAMARNLYYYKI
jgi:hypothetical protein